MTKQPDFTKMFVKKIKAPDVVRLFASSETKAPIETATAIIRQTERTLTPFVEKTSAPLFIFQNPRSGYRQVGNTRYYKESILFWESVNKIMEGRTIKQKIGDVSTEYILSRFTDTTYKNFFKRFYKRLHQLLEQYAQESGLSIPEDIAIFYKGGNLFRIILTPFVRHIKDNEYLETLKKRSDADFQIYINPDLPNYDTIYDEVTKRALFSLYEFKSWLSANHLLNIDPLQLIELYRNLFDSMPELEVTNVALANDNTNPFRSDCIISNVTETATGFKEEYSLLSGFEKCRSDDPSLYISRNTASDFTTFSGKRYYFELLRLKRNIKIVIEYGKLKHKTYLQVPSEVIDISIPKIGDSSLESMKGYITEYIQEYIFKESTRAKFTFWGVSLQYLIYDLTDILYNKFEWPWLDAKYSKRLARFLLCITLQNTGVSKQKLLANLERLLRALNSLRTQKVSVSRALRYSPSLAMFLEQNIELRHRVLQLSEEEIQVKYDEYLNNVLSSLENIKRLIADMQEPSSSLVSRFVTMVGGTKS